MYISIINHSKIITNAQANVMTKAVQKQITSHVAPAWEYKPATVSFYADQKQVPAKSCVVGIFDQPTQANALGYHSEDNDVIDGFIFVSPVLDNKGVVLYDSTNPQNVSVASVLSHEVCEMFGDEFATYWADGPIIPQGNQYALELCDPVESDSYTIKIGKDMVSISNFVYPSWFNPQATNADAPFDYLKKLTAPFSMTPGGYMIVQSAGKTKSVFGESMPDWKKELKQNKFYRR